MIIPGKYNNQLLSQPTVCHTLGNPNESPSIIAVSGAIAVGLPLCLHFTGVNFISGKRHLNSFLYPYGITFISDSYIKAEWTKYFEFKAVHHGAIHDFQDIVVLQAHAT